VFSWTGKYPTAGEVLQLAGTNAMNASATRISNVIHANEYYRLRYISLFGGFPPTCDANDVCECGFGEEP